MNAIMPSPPTHLIERFELRHGYAFVHLSGSVTLDQAMTAVDRALHAARKQGIQRLLVDATELSGFASPSTADRYFISKGWALAAERQVELALVLQPHRIDPDRFGIVVATNLGMRADVFSSPSEALERSPAGGPDFTTHNKHGTKYENQMAAASRADWLVACRLLHPHARGSGAGESANVQLHQRRRAGQG